MVRKTIVCIFRETVNGTKVKDITIHLRIEHRQILSRRLRILHYQLVIEPDHIYRILRVGTVELGSLEKPVDGIAGDDAALVVQALFDSGTEHRVLKEQFLVYCLILLTYKQ